MRTLAMSSAHLPTLHAECPRLYQVPAIVHTKFVKVGSVNIRLLQGRPVESPMQRGEISLEVEEQVEEENLVNSEGNIKIKPICLF